MKKTILILITIILILTFSSIQLKGSEGLKVFANFGLITDDSFTFTDYMWYAGANLDFHINDLIMFSPEINLMTYKFDFKAFFVEPAVLLNFKLGTVFAGGGLTKIFLVSGHNFGATTDFALKLNAGFRSAHMRFRVFVITPFGNIFGENLVGVQFGLGF